MPRLIAQEANLYVVDFGGSEVPLTKRQLSEHPEIKRSKRWIEQRVKDGMPAHWDGNERRFLLSEVKDWLAGRERRAADG